MKGLYKVENDCYYFSTGSGSMLTDRTIWVKGNNAYGLTAGNYDLGADGKLILKSGWVTLNGKTFYYVDNEAVTGLQKINGEYYYFSTGNGRLLPNRTIWVKKNNPYGLAAGNYTVDADGKLIV